MLGLLQTLTKQIKGAVLPGGLLIDGDWIKMTDVNWVDVNETNWTDWAATDDT